MTTRDIIQVTRQMVTEYMAKFDSSHDMYHVERVVALGNKNNRNSSWKKSLIFLWWCAALDIAKDCSTKDQAVDLQVVELAALCHDVGDRKYYQGKETGGQLIEKFLQEHGYEKASLVSKIVDHIGFSKELGWDDQKDPKEQVKWRNSCLELHA